MQTAIIITFSLLAYVQPNRYAVYKTQEKAGDI